MRRTRAVGDDMGKLGAAVKRRRAALGLTQSDVVRLSRCSLDFIVDLEKGRASRLDKTLDVLKVLGIGFMLAELTEPLEVSEELQ